jgi:hypothetical protein
MVWHMVKADHRTELLEILEDWNGRGSTMVISQLPVERVPIRSSVTAPSSTPSSIGSRAMPIDSFSRVRARARRQPSVSEHQHDRLSAALSKFRQSSVRLCLAEHSDLQMIGSKCWHANHAP